MLPPTTSQNISTTTYHHQPLAKIHQQPSTTAHRQRTYTHHHQTLSKIYSSKKVFCKKNIKIFYSEVNNEKHFD